METLRETMDQLLEELRETYIPAVRHNSITFSARKARRNGQLSLYEEYLLTSEALAFERQSYLLPAWPGRVGISNLIKLLNMRMMALLFQEEAAAKKWEAWGQEAYQLLQEKRPHYIADHYLGFLRAEDSPQLLEELLRVRNSRRRPFDDGPYHDEQYPFEDCAYEERLLKREYFTQGEKAISGAVEDILVEISMLD